MLPNDLKKQGLDNFYKEQKKIFGEKVKDCLARQHELTKLCWQYFMDNKLYCPMSVLEQYKDEEIETITLVFANGDIECCSYSDIIRVDENGHFDYSDEFSGIIEYDKDKQKYVKYLYGTMTELNIVGFYNLSLKYSGEVIKTQYKELLLTNKKGLN